MSAPALQAFDRAFQALHRRLPGAWFRERRATAFRYFQEAGFPGPELEGWRYTDPRAWLRLELEPAAVPVAAPPVLPDAPLEGREHDVLVFVGGHYCAARSRVGALPPGVRLAPLCQVLDAGRDEILAQALDDLPFVEGGADAGFSALNTALFNSGLFLRVPDGVRLERPVHVWHLEPEAAAGGPPRCAHVRNLCLLGRGAAACVYESYSSAAAPGSGAPKSLVNSVTQLRLEDAAELRHCKLLRCDAAAHLSYSCAQLGTRAHLHSCYFGRTEALARNELQVRLLGRAARAELNGLYSAAGNGRHACLAMVRHLQRETRGDAFYRGILYGAAHGIFHGAVHIEEHAAHSEATQSNANLLIGERSRAYTRPELHIHADEVQCRHGATVGRLDDASAAYLQSRGLDAVRARALLVRAFAAEAMERFRFPDLQDWLERHVPGGGLSSGALGIA